MLVLAIRNCLLDSVKKILSKITLQVNWRNPRGWSFKMAAYCFGWEFWSQNSDFQVMAGAEEPSPDGNLTDIF
jgi:hypothetical protein